MSSMFAASVLVWITEHIVLIKQHVYTVTSGSLFHLPFLYTRRYPGKQEVRGLSAHIILANTMITQTFLNLHPC